MTAKSVFANPGLDLSTRSVIQLNIYTWHFQLSMLKLDSLSPPAPTKFSLHLPMKGSAIHPVSILNSPSLTAPKFNHSQYSSNQPTSWQKTLGKWLNLLPDEVGSNPSPALPFGCASNLVSLQFLIYQLRVVIMDLLYGDAMRIKQDDASKLLEENLALSRYWLSHGPHCHSPEPAMPTLSLPWLILTLFLSTILSLFPLPSKGSCETKYDQTTSLLKTPQ